jgi:phage antirepressor YoqD-like protein
MFQLELEDGHHIVLYSVSDAAKILNLKDCDGRGIGRNRFFSVLKYNKVLLKDNSPSQYWMNMHLMVLHKPMKRWKRYTMPCFTEKGINYLENQFKSGRFVVHFESKKPVKSTYIKQPDEVF